MGSVESLRVGWVCWDLGSILRSVGIGAGSIGTWDPVWDLCWDFGSVPGFGIRWDLGSVLGSGFGIRLIHWDLGSGLGIYWGSRDFGSFGSVLGSILDCWTS